ncbi:MAG: hypothetical protein HY525_09120 [Betaproteobacteria bacterium]|nr:hypothetical protein [Betaproteobacteria bacterium]
MLARDDEHADRKWPDSPVVRERDDGKSGLCEELAEQRGGEEPDVWAVEAKVLLESAEHEHEVFDQAVVGCRQRYEAARFEDAMLLVEDGKALIRDPLKGLALTHHRLTDDQLAERQFEFFAERHQLTQGQHFVLGSVGKARQMALREHIYGHL